MPGTEALASAEARAADITFSGKLAPEVQAALAAVRAPRSSIASGRWTLDAVVTLCPSVRSPA